MYGKKDKSYQYKVRYIHHDGHESESSLKTDTKDTLLIDDMLTGRAKASFDVIIDTNTVKTAKVEVQYKDTSLGLKEEFSKWFDQTDTWDWSMRLREDATNKFKYRYFAQFQDDMIYSSPWIETESDENIPPIHLKRYPKTLMIDGGLIDWNEWQVIYVSVSYSDEEHNYTVQKNIRLDKDNFLQTFDVLAFSAEAKPFKYSLRYAKAGSAPITVEEKEDNAGLIIIEPPMI